MLVFSFRTFLVEDEDEDEDEEEKEGGMHKYSSSLPLQLLSLSSDLYNTLLKAQV
ncbi:hypothetical protein PZA11_005174 [Diplocarpon coronariae]